MFRYLFALFFSLVFCEADTNLLFTKYSSGIYFHDNDMVSDTLMGYSRVSVATWLSGGFNLSLCYNRVNENFSDKDKMVIIFESDTLKSIEIQDVIFLSSIGKSKKIGWGYSAERFNPRIFGGVSSSIRYQKYLINLDDNINYSLSKREIVMMSVLAGIYSEYHQYLSESVCLHLSISLLTNLISRGSSFIEKSNIEKSLNPNIEKSIKYTSNPTMYQDFEASISYNFTPGRIMAMWIKLAHDVQSPICKMKEENDDFIKLSGIEILNKNISISYGMYVGLYEL